MHYQTSINKTDTWHLKRDTHALCLRPRRQSVWYTSMTKDSRKDTSTNRQHRQTERQWLTDRQLDRQKLVQVRYGGIRRSSASPRPPCDGTPSASVWPSPRQTSGPAQRRQPQKLGGLTLIVWWTDRQTQVDNLTDDFTDIYTNRQTQRHNDTTNKQTHTQWYPQTDRHTVIPTNRQTDIQTMIPTNKQTDRHTHNDTT